MRITEEDDKIIKKLTEILDPSYKNQSHVIRNIIRDKYLEINNMRVQTHKNIVDFMLDDEYFKQCVKEGLNKIKKNMKGELK